MPATISSEKATNIQIEPTETEHVRIRHRDWNCEWLLQFPEMVVANDAVAKHFAPLPQKWRQDGPQAWSYEWRPSPAYFKEFVPQVFKDKQGKPIYELIDGLVLHSAIVGGTDEVSLTLTLTNTSKEPMRQVLCDGGCFGARNPEFGGISAVGRSFVWIDGKMVNLATLDRTVTTKCAYHSDPAGYERPIERHCEGFWGRSSARIGEPAILGAVSTGGDKAVVIGYQHAQSALANAKGNTCLHSRPEFHDIAPGRSVVRRGYVLFGNDVQKLAERLRQRLLSA